MRCISAFAVAILVALVAMPVTARDLYVDNLTGEDFFNGTQPAAAADGHGPLRTITRALQLAQGSDRIVLANTGVAYRESITLFGSRHSGVSRQPFVLAGNGATLDGSQPVPADAWEHSRGNLFRFARPLGSHQQLFLDGRPATRVPVGSMGAVPALEPRQWCYSEGYIYFAVDNDRLPENYDLTFAHLQTGITLYFARNVAILDLTVQGFQLDGINAANTARDVYLAGVTCRGNGRSGVTIGGASQVELDACLLGNNGSAQLLTLPWSETNIRRCRLLGNTAPAWVDRGGKVFLNGSTISGGLETLDPDETPKP